MLHIHLVEHCQFPLTYFFLPRFALLESLDICLNHILIVPDDLFSVELLICLTSGARARILKII